MQISKKFYHLITLFLSMQQLWAVDFKDFDPFQHYYSRQEVLERIAVLSKCEDSNRYYRISEEALILGNLSANEIDYILFFGSPENPKKLHSKKKQMHDLKIAIDPGHFGGIYADLEKRSVHLDSQEGEICLREGDLTFYTALALKELLEKEGATVLMTRKQFEEGALPENFFAYLMQNPKFWTSKDSLSQIFRSHYNRQDLQMRADIINQFSPDLTIILHYNTHSTAEEKKRSEQITSSNFHLAFVPGAFSLEELQEPENRYEFLRLIVKSDLSESVLLSRCIVKHLRESLQIPAIKGSEVSFELASVSHQIDEGIYSRNLLLTRKIHGPVCYGESLVQNHHEESRRLRIYDSQVAGYPCPQRIWEVAKAYLDGILDYLRSDQL